MDQDTGQDFDGGNPVSTALWAHSVGGALPQPFGLDFEHGQGRSRHIPDFVAVLPDGVCGCSMSAPGI
ncbi:hypothetical protein [Streptomyces sp. 2A115]|uniref:hypothetical protein n=1 Tax=Streptomyces sp. 2A115 TaxID=3457439 RepID=UPI003FD40A6C